MKISDEGFEKLKGFEGCRLKAYRCPAGVLTIGYGHTGDVKEGMVISQAQADNLLRKDLELFETGVEKLFDMKLTQHQFDALVDFAYNCGLDNLRQSTLRSRILNRADEKEIKFQFARWNKANGKVLKGLVERRRWEGEWFFV